MELSKAQQSSADPSPPQLIRAILSGVAPTLQVQQRKTKKGLCDVIATKRPHRAQ